MGVLLFAFAAGCADDTRPDAPRDGEVVTPDGMGREAGDLGDAGELDAARVDAARDGGAPDSAGPSSPCADELTDSAPVEGPQGLMIQSHTLDDMCLLERALDHVCRAHRSGGAGIIRDIVLTDVVTADASGRPTETLDEAVLERVLARETCWDNLFLGTIPEVILADPYAPSTVNDEEARWTWLRAAQRVAAALSEYMAREGGGMRWHWYVSYEANLNYFTDATYRASYVALLEQHVRDVKAHNDTPAVLWSPTFWTDPEELSAPARESLQTALTDFFSRVPDVTWVAVQDHLGVSPSFSCADALTYYDLVRAAGASLSSVQLNVEYFELTDGAIRDGDPDELATRIRCYRDAGASLGASFELRYWYRTHGH